MAGGIILLSAMVIVLPLDVVVPIHGLVQLVSNVSRVLILLQNVVKPIFVSFLAGAPLGGILGYLLLSRIDRPKWLLGVVAVFLFYIVFKPKRLPEIRLRPRGFFFIGVLSGCTGSLIGAIDPLMAPFFIRTDLRKESMVATKAACSVAGHVIKIPVFLALQFDYGAYALWIAGMIAAVIVGTKIGTMLLQRISYERFMSLVKIAMMVIAIRLIFKAAPVYWPLASQPLIATQPPQNVIELIRPSHDARWDDQHRVAQRLAIPTVATPPSHALAEPARGSEDAAWERVKASSHPQDLMAFLLAHPNSRFSFAADMRYQQLKRQRLRHMQNRLKEVGLDPGLVDGIFGRRTRAALRQYQQAHSLPMTGRLDSATAAALQLESRKIE